MLKLSEAGIGEGDRFPYIYINILMLSKPSAMTVMEWNEDLEDLDERRKAEAKRPWLSPECAAAGGAFKLNSIAEMPAA